MCMNKEKQNPNANENFKLTTEEAIRLIDMMKKRVIDTTLQFPQLGNKLEFDVFAQKEGAKFIVNITRSSIDKKKCTYQGRTYINSMPLLRLDITNSTHMNSDGTKIVGNHLHIYNEDTQMREAIPFDVENADLYVYCLQFFEKFHIMHENCNVQYQMEI